MALIYIGIAVIAVELLFIVVLLSTVISDNRAANLQAQINFEKQESHHKIN